MISVEKLLKGKPNAQIFFLEPRHMVIEALEIMAQENIGALIVLENKRLVGVFSEREYTRQGILKGRKAKSTPVTEVMRRNVPIVTPEMDLEDCMKLMNEHRVRHLPVVSQDVVIGLLSIGDIVKAILEEYNTHIKFLEEYMTS